MSCPRFSHWACGLAALLVAGCASKAENIPAAYVSPIAYDSYTCPQLQEEAARVSARAAQAAGIQNDHARNDAIATTAAVVIFFPAAFFINGEGANAADLARLKGEADAIEQASIKKHCGFSIQRG